MRLPLWFRRQDEDLDEEIAGHLQMAVRDRVERGESVDQATTAARREFGNVTRIKEVTREMWGWIWLEQLWQDARYAWRICQKAPAFTATAILSLSVGIGANTAIFTLVDAVVLKRLAVPQPDQLVNFTDRDRPGETASYSYPDFEQLRSQSSVLAGLSARQSMRPPLTRDGRSEAVSVAFVSASYFEIMRIPALVGRTISQADDSIPANPVAMLGYDYWQRHFGGDPGVIGRVVHIMRRPFTVIGVTSASVPGLSLGSPDEILVPVTTLNSAPWEWDLNDVRSQEFQLIGRLQPGVTVQQAEAVVTAELQRAHAAWAPRFPWRVAQNRIRFLERAITLAPGSRGLPEGLRGRFAGPLLVLTILVAVVLGMACANVANLLLARASARQREIEMRVALGASRGRLLRQLLTESLLLAAVGGALGVVVAWWGSGWIVSSLSLGEGRTPLLSVALDLRTLTFTVTISMLTGLAFGLAPVVHAFKRAAAPALRDDSGAAGGPAASRSLRRALILAQVAFGVLLLATAGLFGRTLWNLKHLDTGIDRAHVLMFKVFAESLDNGAAAAKNQRRVEAQQRITAIPGVRAATLSMFGGFRAGARLPVLIDDRPPVAEPPSALQNLVTASYFETLGMPIVRGRTWSTEVDLAAPALSPVVVNQALSRLLFGDDDPIGRRIRSGGSTYDIIGVVQDARYLDLRETPPPAFFGPLTARETVMQVIYVRTELELSSLAPVIERALQADGIITSHVQSLEQYTDEAISEERIVAGLSSVLGAVAALLTAVGLYGVVAYWVTRRTREIGVRVALGAARRDILRLVIGEVAAVVAVGLVAGLLTTSAVTRLARSLLFGISPTDPATLGVSVVLMCLIAGVAAYLPARRALSSDPVSALRCE